LLVLIFQKVTLFSRDADFLWTHFMT
jgi:hypothetical protein